MSWSLEQNEITRLTAAQKQACPSLADLTSANPTKSFSGYPHVLLQSAFTSIDDFLYEPEPFGLPGARIEVSRYYARRGISVDPERIVLTATTSEAYAYLFKLFCDPGDQVLIPSPSYPLFEYLAGLENVSFNSYHLRYDGAWYLDFADLTSRITKRTKAIVVVNPNNPTGSFITAEERNRLAHIAAEHQLPVISDEVFMDYGIRPRSGLSKTMIDCEETLSFSLNGLSKAAGMPQVKLAWIVVNGPPKDRALALERLELVSDTYLSVATPVQKALPSLLAAGEAFQSAIRTRLMTNVAQIDQSLPGTSGQRLQMDGGWSAIVRVPATRTEEQWITTLLTEREVLVQPGYYFDLPFGAHLIVSLITEPTVLQEGLARIRAQLLAAA